MEATIAQESEVLPERFAELYRASAWSGNGFAVGTKAWMYAGCVMQGAASSGAGGRHDAVADA